MASTPFLAGKSQHQITRRDGKLQRQSHSVDVEVTCQLSHVETAVLDDRITAGYGTADW